MDRDFSVIFPDGNPQTEHLPLDKRKILIREFTAWTPYGVITAPAGFRTDGFSIPRPLWTIMGDPWNRFAAAAIIHDYLYDTQGLRGAFDRKTSDKVFKWLLLALGMNELRARLMYRGVRLGGASGWRN
jgi:hypothetical protein